MPGSTTYRMPGTVSDVSATLVASTIRRPVCGANTRCCSAADSRAYSGSDLGVGAGRCRPQRVGGVADLPLAGEEHQDVARPLGAQLVDGLADRLDLVAYRLAVVVGSSGASSTSGR